MPADASGQLAQRTIDDGFRDRGLPCLYDACWANGAVVFGAIPTNELSAIEYAFGATTSAVSKPKSASNGALSYVGRVGVTGGDQRFDLLRVGLSASYGPYLQADATGVAPAALTGYQQIVLGTDVSLEWQQLRVYPEAIRNWWQVPHLDEGTLGMWGGYAEAQWDLFDWWYLGLLYFDSIEVDGTQRPWDYHVHRFEPALGFPLAPGAIIKLVTQISLRSGPSDDDSDFLFAGQLALAL